MENGSSNDLLSALIVIGGLVGSTLLALFFARRARAARRRLLDGADERKSIEKKSSNLLRELDQQPEAEDDAAGGPTDAPSAAGPEPATSGAAPPAGATTVTDAAPRSAARAALAIVEAEPSDLTARPSATAVPIERPRGAAGSTAPRLTIPITTATGDTAALARGLSRTRASWVKKLGGLFSGKKSIDPALVDDIERVLLTADIGIRTANLLLADLRASLSRKELADTAAVWRFLRQRTVEILNVPAPPFDIKRAKPFVLLMIGVNGTGKTTTIGKLAAKLRGRNKNVLLAAGDTFRAAAVEQLEVWASKTQSSIVRGKENADPSSVIFDAVKKAQTEGADVVIADTAGRLHTKSDLMDELQKVRRVVGKAMEGAPHETWLVLDSTSGQNAIAQAQIFTQAMQVTGLVLTKLDGTAKGGVIIGIADELKIPVRFIGVGEGVDDLRPFDAEEFATALFEDADKDAELTAAS